MDVTLAGGVVTYLPDADQMSRVSLEFAAFDGEVGHGILPIPDEAAANTIADGRSCRVNEIDTRVTDGYILDQDRTRGPFRVGTTREDTFGVMDANALLDGFRIDRSRSAETDYARVMAFAAADGPTWDTTWVLNSSTVTMPKKHYRSDGGWTSELIPDVVSYTGKTLFLHDKALGGRCLHYHLLTTGHTCGLVITDVPGAVNGITTFAPQQPRRTRTSVDLRNDVTGRDQTGRTSTATDSTSITAHDADGLLHQSLMEFEAKSQADLDAQTDAMLASLKDERDTYECSIGPLDATALSLIRVGDRITVTSSVMGLTASAQRIAHMTLTMYGTDPMPGLWNARLEMGQPIRRRARVRQAPVVGPWVCIPNDFTVYTNQPAPTMACVIPNGSGANDCFSNIADANDVMTLYNGATYRVLFSVDHSTNSNALSARLGGTGSTIAITNMGSLKDGTNYSFADVTVAVTSTENYHAWLVHTAYSGRDPTGCSIDVTVVYISGTDPRYEGLSACSNGEPAHGQATTDPSFSGDATTSSFTTGFPYLGGSLRVFVDNVDQTAAVTEDDPEAGTWSFAFAPELDETVQVYYVAD